MSEMKRGFCARCGFFDLVFTPHGFCYECDEETTTDEDRYGTGGEE